MDTLLLAAEAALRRTSAPALRLGDLLREVRADTRDTALDGGRLRRALEAHPDLFRVLDPWRGPWRLIRTPDEPSTHHLDPWVVVVSDPAGGDGAQRPSTRRLQACVRWLARGVDGRSRRDVARWSALAVSAEETHRALAAAA